MSPLYRKMSKDLAPITLFVYNRPWHTEKTLESLMANDLAKDSILYIFADGPENFLPELSQKIQETRDILRKKQWCKEVIIFESSVNLGLLKSITSGVTRIVEKHGKVIVLEDDINTSLGFLKYMNDALDIYKSEESVMHISGYMYPIKHTVNDGTIFLKILSCWGWGTWQRAWKYYSNDLNSFIKKLDSQTSIDRFNIKGNGTFYDQLKQNHEGTLKTWAVRWYASWYFMGGISLFPKITLVKNIGFDGSGVHSPDAGNYKTDILADTISVVKLPPEEDHLYLDRIDDFYKKERQSQIQNKPNNTYIKKIKIKIYGNIAWIIDKLLYIYILYSKRPIIFHRNINYKISNSFLSKKAKLYGYYRLSNSFIDDYTYIAHNSNIEKTKIGRFCSIGPNFLCGRGIHPVTALSTSPMFYSTMKQNGITLSTTDKEVESIPINIGNDVFIGMNVTVLDGIVIGDGAIIGAGAVVSKDIPPYAVAVGNPIKIIKYRFDENKRNQLLKIKWWDFEDERLHEIESYFYDVDEFINKNINN